MTDTGLPQAYDFGTAKIFACVIFGAIGFGALVYGKNKKAVKPTFIGIALMTYPYFVSGTVWLYAIGVVLTAALYFWR